MEHSLTHLAEDIRQSPMWANYLQSMGWKIKHFGSTYMYINHVKLLNRSFAKIQHPKGPINVAEIDQYAKEHRIDTVLIEPHIVGHQEQPYLDQSFHDTRLKFSGTATILIDLRQNSTQLLKSYSQNAQRNISKAQKNNIKTKIVTRSEDPNLIYFNKCYGLIKNVSRIKKFYIPSYMDLQKKYLALDSNQFLIFAYTEKTTEPIAVVWYGYYQNTLVYLHTGITEQGYQQLANYLLVHDGLLYAQQLNLEIFDFEVIYDDRYPQDRKRWSGYTEFKKRFHGELVYYPMPRIKNYSLFGKIIFH